MTNAAKTIEWTALTADMCKVDGTLATVLTLIMFGRAGGFADCRVRQPRKSKCLCPSQKLQKNVVFLSCGNKRDQTVLRTQGEWLSSNVIQEHGGPLSFHKYEPRGLEGQKKNL